MVFRALKTSAAAIACLFAAPAAAQQLRPSDAPPAETRIFPYGADLPLCDDVTVLAQIRGDFDSRERNDWDTPLGIDSFAATRETGFRSKGLSYIPRRYCQADALVNDGSVHKVVYTIGEGAGFLGYGSGVTWCIVGMDRNHAFAPDCEALRR
jgi:hypothetical protein